MNVSGTSTLSVVHPVIVIASVLVIFTAQDPNKDIGRSGPSLVPSMETN